MTIVFFDLDGTLTTKDTMFQFIRFAKGKVIFYTGLLILSPVLMAYRMGLLPNWRAKEIVFSFYFKGMSVEKAQLLGQAFATQVFPKLLHSRAMREIEFHQEAGAQIVVVTASFGLWVKPWCDLHHFDLIATEHDSCEGIISGLMKGKNCHGEEKVRRIKEKFDILRYEKIYAYGDSTSDIKMLNLAHFKYLKWEPID